MKRILIIEDDTIMRENTAEILELAGYAVTTAPNGKAGSLLAKELRPDLVICDIMMPELDGYGVATMLKADPVTAAIPIIMVSAHEGRGARLIGLESGAEDYMTKPVDPVELIAKIRNLLLLRKRAAHALIH